MALVETMAETCAWNKYKTLLYNDTPELEAWIQIWVDKT